MIERKNHPRHWEFSKLGDLVKRYSLKALPTDYPNAKFVGMDCILPHTLKPHFLYDFKEFKSSGNSFKKNQVLYGRMRPYLNKVYKADFDGVCSGEFIILDCDGLFNPDLLKYILHSRDFVNFANKVTTGDRPRITYEEISEYGIAVPPMREQTLIVSKLEELFSELDKGIEQLKTAQQQLKVYRQAVLKYAFEGRLTNKNVKEGKLPEGWKSVSVQEVATIFSGYAFKSEDFKQAGIYQVIRMGNVRPGKIRPEEKTVYLDKVDKTTLQRSLLLENDVIITLTGTRKKRDYGFTALIKQKNLLLNQRIASVRFLDKYMPKFFLYFTWTDGFKDQFFANETGNVGQGNVGVKGVTQTLIPNPNIEEQREIVQQIESRFSVCEKFEETINNSLKQSEGLRQSILKKTFEGGILNYSH